MCSYFLNEFLIWISQQKTLICTMVGPFSTLSTKKKNNRKKKKKSNYHYMQNAWSMDFISWFFSHVSQLEFMLLASLPQKWPGRVRRHNEGGRGGPSTSTGTSICLNAGRQGCQRRAMSRRVHSFCDHAEGDSHWLCAVWHRITGERKGQGQTSRKRGKKKKMRIVQGSRDKQRLDVCVFNIY